MAPEIDLTGDEFFPLNRAPFPGNPSAPTRWRWRQKGINGVKLEVVTVGGRPFVTRAAIERFIRGVTAAANGEQPSLRSPAKRERDIARAEKELAAAGI